MTASANNRLSVRSDGFIIVAVLWLLAALAALVSIYAIYVRDTANAFAAYDERLQSEELTTAGIELVAYQLTSTPIQSRPTHGTFDWRIGKANVTATFQTEAARIDLNVASKELLTGLFLSLGEGPNRAADYADRIAQWRTPPKDQVSALTNQANAPNANAARSVRFFHVDELMLVPGLPAEVAERALPLVTVYSGRQQVNVMEAAPEVLAALPGMNRGRLAATLAAREGLTDGKALAQVLGPAQNYATTEAGGADRVTIEVAYDNGRRTNSQVVMVPFEEGPEPYAILSWEDNLEPSAPERRRIASQ